MTTVRQTDEFGNDNDGIKSDKFDNKKGKKKKPKSFFKKTLLNNFLIFVFSTALV